MKHTVRACTLALVACLILAPAGWAQLSSFNEDFEGLDSTDIDALLNTGWLVFGNVFDGDTGDYLFGYGPFGAPNDGANFSAIVSGEGGAEQGAQQLSVFSDYSCCFPDTGHFGSDLVEANVFQEQIVGAGDVGSTWLFQFDAKSGNIELDTTAFAFIKTLDPVTFGLSRFLTVDMTAIPDTWGTFSIELEIEADLEGHILQIGFLSNATDFQGSGIFYDNVGFNALAAAPSLTVSGSCPGTVTLTVDNMTASGPIAIAFSTAAGMSSVPGGSCAGTPLGLATPSLLTLGTTDANGTFTIDATAPAAACGASLQALDSTTCETTDVVALP